MTIKEAQETVDKWISTYGEQSKGTARIETKDLADELSDVLFVLVCLANQTGVDLEKAFQKNLQKKTARDFERHQQNDKLRYPRP